MNKKTEGKIFEEYRKSAKRLVLLDYDGTLVDHKPNPDTAIPTEKLNIILTRLANIRQTEIYIITGRGFKDIDKLISHLSVSVIADHGAMMKEKEGWKSRIIDSGIWKKTIIPVLEEFTLKCPDSFVEEKAFSVAWHYRNSENAAAYALSRDLLQKLETHILAFKLKLMDGKKVIEIMPKESGKGNAAKKLFELKKPDIVLVIGDDVTDEEMFEYFLDKTQAITIKVGNGETLAKYSLNNIDNVVHFLKQLTE